MKFRLCLPFLLLIVLSFAATAFAEDPAPVAPAGVNAKQVIIFHDSSLTATMEKAANAFEAKNPGTKVILKNGGGVDLARQAMEQKDPCDILAVADYGIIDNMVKPNYAKYNILFARDRMVILYSDKSKYAKEINAENWYRIFARPDVAYGYTDPNLYPGGYRAIFVMQLTEKYYKVPGLYDKLAQSPQHKVFNTPDELKAALAAGTVDYAIAYASVAKNWGMHSVALVDSADLSALDSADYYSTVSVKIAGKEPGILQEIKGLPICYGVTLLDNAQNKEAAVAFLQYFLNDGTKIINDSGLTRFGRAEVSLEDFDEVPAGLKDSIQLITPRRYSE